MRGRAVILLSKVSLRPVCILPLSAYPASSPLQPTLPPIHGRDWLLTCRASSLWPKPCTAVSFSPINSRASAIVGSGGGGTAPGSLLVGKPNGQSTANHVSHANRALQRRRGRSPQPVRRLLQSSRPARRSIRPLRTKPRCLSVSCAVTWKTNWLVQAFGSPLRSPPRPTQARRRQRVVGQPWRRRKLPLLRRIAGPASPCYALPDPRSLPRRPADTNTEVSGGHGWGGAGHGTSGLLCGRAQGPDQ